MAGKKYLSKINKEGNDLFIKDEESQDALFFKDVYIGAAAQSTTIKTSTYHYDTIAKGSLLSMTSNGHKIWLVFPETSDVPHVFMSGMDVSMELHETTVIEEKTYKVYKSVSPFTGTFNVQLF